MRHPNPARLDESTPVGWDIFDPDGVLVGEISLPIGLSLQDVGEDYLLGVRFDSLDIETVELYSLTRG